MTICYELTAFFSQSDPNFIGEDLGLFDVRRKESIAITKREPISVGEQPMEYSKQIDLKIGGFLGF
jgi:hypothetical protein